MGKGINKVQLLGYVGKDPESVQTQGGMLVSKFSLATSDRKKDQSGSWVDDTTWHNIVAFGRTAEIVQEYVTNGSYRRQNTESVVGGQAIRRKEVPHGYSCERSGSPA